MFNSVVTMSRASKVYLELEGKRVLIAGLKPGVKAGTEIVRAFAAQGCRLVLQFDSPQGARSEELFGLADEVTGQTLGIRVFSGPLDNDLAVARMTTASLKAFNGLDAVVTVSHLPDETPPLSSEEDFDSAVAATLRRAYLISRVAANRMRLVSAEGTVLNVLAPPTGSSRANTVLFALARAELEAMTRLEAETWKDGGIRFASLAPEAAIEASGSFAAVDDMGDVAATALFLASDAGAFQFLIQLDRKLLGITGSTGSLQAGLNRIRYAGGSASKRQ